MYHPTTRLLTILELLQTRGQMSGSELAALLEVDARTVRRYVQMLQELGIPIEAEMGRHGGYALRPGFKLPPMMFTNEEALSLMLGLLAARQIGWTTETWSIDSAFAKIQRVLPDALREQAQALQSALVFDFTAPEQRIETTLLMTLSQAIHSSTAVKLAYRKDSQTSRRRVDPYGVVSHDGGWYLVGYCHLRTGIRVFRLDRVVDVSLTDDTFTPPVNFDSLEYLIHSFAVIPDQWTVEVILQTTPEQARQKIPPALGLIEPHEDGVLLHTEISDLDWMARYLVGLGFPLAVCEPPELRVAFERLALEIAQYAQLTP